MASVAVGTLSVVIRSFNNKSMKEKRTYITNVRIAHGEEGSVVEVFRATPLVFCALGNRKFVALEVSE
jgi:hypothetical protein